MAPRTTKPKPDDPDPLAPKTDRAKVEKTKTPKIKTEKVDKQAKAKPKADKAAAAPPKAKVESTAVKDGKDGKGEKVKAVSGDEAVVLIAEYLRATNRPYSATEVSANLHGKVTKTVADKVLKEMEQSGVIMGKATNGDKKGSQWVFWALQDPADASTPTELATMDSTISALRTSLPARKSTLRSATARLSTILSAPTTAALATTIQTLRAANAAKVARLQGFRDGTVVMVSREEVERVEGEYRYWRGKERRRREAFRGLEEAVLQGGGGTGEELWERLGIEE